MRALDLTEIEEVNGGIAPILGGIIVGAATGAASPYFSGGSSSAIVLGAVTGAAGGFYGSINMIGSAVFAGVVSIAVSGGMGGGGDGGGGNRLVQSFNIE